MQGIGNIRVLLLKNGSGWWAQGLEMDYGAEGRTIKEAKIHFEKGLQELFRWHEENFGHPWNLFSPRGAPLSFWQKLANGVATKETKTSDGIFPFDGIDFLKMPSKKS